MHGGIVNEETVLVLAVIAKRLTVIAKEDDQSMVVDLPALKPGDQAPELVLRIRDFPVIKMTAVLSAIRFGRIVRTVGIVQMKPEEKWPARSFLQSFLIKPIH